MLTTYNGLVILYYVKLHIRFLGWRARTLDRLKSLVNFKFVIGQIFVLNGISG